MCFCLVCVFVFFFFFRWCCYFFWRFVCFISFLIQNVGCMFCWIFVLRVLKSTPNKAEPPKALVVVALDLLVGLGVVDEEEDPPEAGRVARDRR